MDVIRSKTYTEREKANLDRDGLLLKHKHVVAPLWLKPFDGPDNMLFFDGNRHRHSEALEEPDQLVPATVTVFLHSAQIRVQKGSYGTV